MALGTLVPLKLEHVFDLRLSFGEELRIGPTSLGHSRVIHLVAGGTVSGPRLSGVVIPNSGSDAPCRAEDRTVIEGELMIRAHDGTLILMKNAGYAPSVLPSAPWRTDQPEFARASLCLSPKFEAPDGPHAWLNRTVFVGKGDRRLTDASIRIFAVM
jgi:Protein of unknown function (DUF3237)